MSVDKVGKLLFKASVNIGLYNSLCYGVKMSERDDYKPPYAGEWNLNDFENVLLLSYISPMRKGYELVVSNMKRRLEDNDMGDLQPTLQEDKQFGPLIRALMAYELTSHRGHFFACGFQQTWEAFDNEKGFRDQFIAILTAYVLRHNLYLKFKSKQNPPTLAFAIKTAEKQKVTMQKVTMALCALRHHIPSEMRVMLAEDMRGLS